MLLLWCFIAGSCGVGGGLAAAAAFAAVVSLVAVADGWLVARLGPWDPALAVALNLAAVTLRNVPLLVALGWLNSGGKGLLAIPTDATCTHFITDRTNTHRVAKWLAVK